MKLVDNAIDKVTNMLKCMWLNLSADNIIYIFPEWDAYTYLSMTCDGKYVFKVYDNKLDQSFEFCIEKFDTPAGAIEAGVEFSSKFYLDWKWLDGSRPFDEKKEAPIGTVDTGCITDEETERLTRELAEKERLAVIIGDFLYVIQRGVIEEGYLISRYDPFDSMSQPVDTDFCSGTESEAIAIIRRRWDGS